MRTTTLSGGLPPPTIEYDPYVPFTACWRVGPPRMDAPSIVTVANSDGFLEFKFHPEERHLLEAVLVTALRFRLVDLELAPELPEMHDEIPFLPTVFTERYSDGSLLSTTGED